MAAEARELEEMLTRTRGRLFRAIEGVTEEQFRRRPDADAASWSIAEVLGHLLAYERMEGERIGRALAEDGAAITPSPPAAHEEGARAGRRGPVPQIIHGLLGVRREIGRLVERAACLEGGFDRAVVHPVRGRDTIRWMVVEKVIDHEAEHAAQIEALRPAVGAPPVREEEGPSGTGRS